MYRHFSPFGQTDLLCCDLFAVGELQLHTPRLPHRPVNNPGPELFMKIVDTIIQQNNIQRFILCIDTFHPLGKPICFVVACSR